MPQEAKPLLERARKVARVTDWARYVANLPTYYWLNHHELLFFRGGWNEPWKLFRRDIVTGCEEVLYGLSDFCQRKESNPWSIRISPDGTLLLFRRCKVSLGGGYIDKNAKWLVANLSGQLVTSWPCRRGRDHTFLQIAIRGKQSCTVWLPDSKSILESVSDWDYASDTAILRSWIQPIAPPQPARELSLIGINSANHPGDPVVDSEMRRLLTITFPKAQRCDVWTRIRILSWKIDGVNRPATVSQVDGPQGLKPLNFQFSPDRREIVWTVKTAESHAVVGPDYHAPPRNAGKIGLWISRANGQDMKEIGSIPVKPGRERDVYAHFGGVSWLPDSRRLSFLYDGHLWIV